MPQSTQSGWTSSSIRELEGSGDIELGRGQIISQKDIEATPGDYPVYSSSASGSGEFGRYGKFMFDEELVTWSVDGGGKFFYRPKGKFSITNVSGFLRIKAKDKLDAYYVWAHLYSIWETMTFNYTEKLHPSILRERFSFSYPPIPEQQRIAQVLSTVQEAIEQQERLIRTTTELKQALMQKLFTEGLRGEAQKETEIGLVPESWEVVKVMDTGSVVTGSTPSTSRADFYGGNYDLVSPGDLDRGKYIGTVQKKLTALGFDQCRKLPKGAVLVGCIGNIGKLGIVSNDRSATNQQINAIVPNDRFNGEFLYYAIHQHRARLESMAGKVTIPLINKSNFERFQMAAPKRDVQDVIASSLDAVDKKTAVAEKKRDALQNLFRTLLHELMTGKVRVGNLMP
jgi:type I restriction enzyme S subunit